MIKNILFCLILVASGCSSAPKPETQHYVLTSNQQTTLTAQLNASQTSADDLVAIKPIKLADFLDQPGIVLQTDTHQINVAHYHRWGEPLKRNLHRYILSNLAAQLPQKILQNESTDNTTTPNQHLDITINQFHGTADGMALLSGHWGYKHSDTKTFSLNKPFSYQASLKNSGYPELVNQLALLLDELCSDIASSINASIEE